MFSPIICVSTERNNVNSDLKIWFKNLCFTHFHGSHWSFYSEGHLAKISSGKLISFFFSSFQIFATFSLVVILQIAGNWHCSLVLIITVDFEKQS